MNEVHRVPTSDGCQIACEFLPREDAPVVMLSPSLGTNMALFDAQLELLSEYFGVLRYDPRGHGTSSVSPGDYSLDRLGQDALELLDHFAISRVHFVGVSLGGMTGQWLGSHAPDRLISLTLANTSAHMGPASAWEDRIAAVRTHGMHAVVDPVMERWFTPAFRESSPEETARIAAILEATDPDGYAGCCAAIRDMDLRLELETIDVPTLVIAGARDQATPPEHAALLADSIRGSKLVTLDGAHLCNVERPVEFNSALASLLEAS